MDAAKHPSHDEEAPEPGGRQPLDTASITPRSSQLNRIVAGTALALAGGAAVFGLEPAAISLLAVALVTVVVPRPVEPEPMQRPMVELARCRRHGRQGGILVASLASRTRPSRRRRIAEQLTRSLRVTDGIAVLDGRSEGPLLCGVFTDPEVEALPIELRLRSIQPELDFGWARFPADGVTLEELLGVAGDRSLPSAHVPQPAALPLRTRTNLAMQASSTSSWRKEG